jgi:hypothetical protein
MIRVFLLNFCNVVLNGSGSKTKFDLPSLKVCLKERLESRLKGNVGFERNEI